MVGPTLRDGAIVYDDIAGIDDLPAGWTDEQEGGHYRLCGATTRPCSATPSGPTPGSASSIPPTLRLWRATRTERRRASTSTRAARSRPLRLPRRPLLRAARDRHAGPRLPRRPATSTRTTGPARERAFVVAVNCGEAGGTCFCVSMGTGPRRRRFGFDLALTELLANGRHDFLAEVGTDAGRRGCSEASPLRGRRPLRTRPLPPAIVERTAASDGPADGHRRDQGAALSQSEHPRWDDVAERCLTCGNCTMVCPTCFCTTVEDAADLTGENGRAVRGAGTPASRSTTRTSTAAASAPAHVRATGSG